MSKTKKPTPYDPKLVAAQCDPSALRLGCAAGCWKGENFDMCGKPIVAIRRWPEGDGESFGGVCQRHAKQAGAELVPLENVPQ